MAADKALDQLTAGELMKKDVITIARTAPLSELVRLLGEHRVSGMPVTDEAGTVVGIVSARDLLERYAEDSGRPAPRPAGFYETAVDEDMEDDTAEFGEIDTEETEDTVADIMTGEVYSVGRGATVAEIAATMLDHGVHRLLVTDKKRYVGLVSSFDLLRALAR